jgi:glutamate synthase (NADPH/NADH) small chain
VADSKGSTTRVGVFAAGDVVQGPSTVVHTVQNAKRVALSMHEHMKGL